MHPGKFYVFHDSRDESVFPVTDCVNLRLDRFFKKPVNMTELLDATGHVLREGGQFVTFAYLQGLLLPAGQRFKRKLRDHFGQVETSRTVWANMPPAFVYRCRK